MAKNTSEPISGDEALAGILSVLVADREERLSDGKDVRKTEVILASAGLAPAQIAALIGKNVDAVRKAIQRGRS